MKTAMQQLIDFLEPELKMHDFLQLPAYEKAKELLKTEKQQHEETAIDMCNICLDNIGNPNSKMEEKFNEYWRNTFETNKETLK